MGTVFEGDAAPAAAHSLLLKLVVVARLEAGERLGTLARRLKLRRQLLYDWRDRFRRGGADALRGPGRPRRPPASTMGVRDLGHARQRIAELERELIERRLDLDLLQKALRVQRLMDDADRPPRRLRPRGRP
ncbi:helix-turn-helix domain-containing protein [Vineibacter terrae]|uniref:helix-turn-helix domain-containing protein n=1 Tax=Vineibacter terrae TaxID=2586908 RepID=UPI002E3690A7|nr:helix-turn-helix domain-containing protein [Vineibacter terrae]HEX2892256.1 helix-turn-helix domain-containing protein [Vineibacter terrae]